MAGDGQNQDTVSVSPRTALWVLVRAPDSYGLVLALLVVSFILAPLGQGSNWLLSRVVVQGATMMFALHTSRVHRRTMRLAGVLLAISLPLSLVVVISNGSKEAQGAVEALLALLLAISVPAMLRRILTTRDVGVEVVIGAMDVYIIVGLFFAAAYGAIAAFSSTPFFTPPAQVDNGSYQFFSFVTLTTVGYGNLVPDTYIGQSLAVLEALLGQVYLVTLVARLVSGMQPGTRKRVLERLAAEREAQSAADNGPVESGADPHPTAPDLSAAAPADEPEPDRTS